MEVKPIGRSGKPMVNPNSLQLSLQMGKSQLSPGNFQQKSHNQSDLPPEKPTPFDLEDRPGGDGIKSGLKNLPPVTSHRSASFGKMAEIVNSY
jgi:hypothetical protein